MPACARRVWETVYPTEVLLPEESTGLRAASLAICHQLRTVSAHRLSRSNKRLQDIQLRAAVEAAIRLWLDISGESQR
ncbi:MAG: type II toxin-antitoxin system PemK/MazF family toxin, partial [bacterium]|nr:type II toxin-antitoxin system PemK/MazF family toxin [bacterium]